MSRKKSTETLTLGQKLADRCANIIGSWKFIGIQSSFLIFWILLNLLSPKKPDRSEEHTSELRHSSVSRMPSSA